MRNTLVFAALTMTLVLAPILAQPPAKKGPEGPGPAIQLSPEQRDEMKRLADGAAEKFGELRRRESEIVSLRQQGAAEAARTLAKAAGLKGPEERTLLEQTAELSAAQQRELAQIERERLQLTERLIADFQKILTPQQRLTAPTKGKAILKLPPGLQLTEREQMELAEIVRDFEQRRAELEAQAAEVLTDAQRAALEEAKAAAKAAGHKGKEEQAAVRAALRLTEQQQAELEALEKRKKELEESVRAKVARLLEPS
jgi:hypothetical protein